MSIFDDIAGKITPISKKEVDEFKLLIAEEAFFSENPHQIDFSNSFPPELAATIGALGTGAVGVAAVFATLAGLSGAEIMGALASFGIAGAVGGIASVAAIVAAPAVLVGGGIFHVANQRKLGLELDKLIKQSYKFERVLNTDNRDNVQGLLQVVREYRDNLKKKHSDLQEINDDLYL